MKHLQNERGVALIFEIILVAAVLAVVGFAVLTSGQVKKTPVASTSPTPSSTPAATPDLTATWTKYTSITGKFSLKYHPDWKPYTYTNAALSTCQKDAKDNVLNLDTLRAINTVIGCGGGPIGQVHISAIEGPKNTSFSETPSLFTDLKSEVVTVDGVDGMRYAATSLQNLLQIQKGERTVEYHFYANGKNYSFIMEQHATSADIISNFDLMVKTIKFSN